MVSGIVAHMVVVRFYTRIHPVNFLIVFLKLTYPFLPQVDTVVAPEEVAAMAAVLVADMVETLEEDDIESF